MQSTLDFNPTPPKLVTAMSSLAQLLAAHRRILVLDGASQRVQAGLLRKGTDDLWYGAMDEAGRSVFTGTESLLHQASLTLDEVEAFIFCEGPGSMLGTRTIAMALRTWLALKPRPVYRYQSLVLAARYSWVNHSGRELTVVADARRDTWHCQSILSDGSMPELRRIAAHALPAGELLTPENFRAWSKPPRLLTLCPYDLPVIFPAVADENYFHPTDSPDAFQHEAPEYKKWSSQPHRASSTRR